MIAARARKQEQFDRRGQVGWFIVAVVLSLSGLALVMRTVPESELWLVIRQLRAPYILAAFGLVAAFWFLGGLRLRTLLSLMGEKLDLWQAIQINLATTFVAGITPMSAGGPPAQAYFLYRRGVAPGKAAAVATLQAILSAGFFVPAVSLIIFILHRLFALGAFFYWATALALALNAAGIATFFYFSTRPMAIYGLARWFLERPLICRLIRNPRKISRSLYREMLRFTDGMKLLLKNGWYAVFLLGGYTVGLWGIFFAVGPVLLAGLGLTVSWWLIVSRQIVLYFLISNLPLPGGSGVAELGLASLFAPVLPKYLLSGFVVGWRFFTYYINLAIGWPVFLHQLRSKPQRAAADLGHLLSH